MKRSGLLRCFLYQVLAVALLLFGGGILVGAFLPVINPGLVAAERGTVSQPVAVYIIGGGLGVLLLALSWHFNTKCRKARRDLES